MRTNTSKPIYQQLISDLKKQIVNGVYKAGELLPSENDLSASYDTTRMTVRQALKELSNMGYISRRHGKGSIVSEPKNGLGILSIKGVTAGVGSKDLHTKLLQQPIKAYWPDKFPHSLSTYETKMGCVHFSRIRIVNDQPVMYEETYITNDKIPRFVTRNLENKSLFKTLKDYYNIEVKGGEQKIWAIQSNRKLSTLLKVDMNSPILHLKRKLITNQKGIHIYSHLYCNTANFFLEDFF